MADGNRTAAGPLRGRIPAIEASQLQPLREFFQRHQHWLLPDNGTLRFAPGHPAAADEVFELDADGSRLACGCRRRRPPATCRTGATTAAAHACWPGASRTNAG